LLADLYSVLLGHQEREENLLTKLAQFEAGEPEYYFVFCYRSCAVCFAYNEGNRVRITEFQEGLQLKNKCIKS
jgi:hypothetical protein